MSLPFLTGDVPAIDGELRACPEDFVVDEVPAYPPEGEGDHVFIRIEKRGLTTPDAVEALCEAVGADRGGAGWAGLKDRHATTRQWISLEGTSPEAVLGATLDGVRVLEAVRHRHKLRTGHLRANRFSIHLRDVDERRFDDLRRVLRRIESEGLPNYYGEQRFGRDRDNASRARAWVTGAARPPRARFHRKLQLSALQSEVFNRVVAERVETSTLGKIFPGELVKKHESGGMFAVDDVEEAQARADRWEISPTGPLFGAKMRWPEGEARIREEAALVDSGLTLPQLARWRKIAPGTRRFLRVPVGPVTVDVAHRTVRLDFTLPAGSYATILVREIFKRDARPSKSG